MRFTPFLRGNVWWARIPRLEKNAVQRSLDVTGKDNRDVALEVCVFLRWLKGRRESFLLDQLAAGTTRVGAAYSAYVDNRLEAFIAELREGIQDVDLEPFVATWQRELERRKKPNAQTRAKYLRQVRTLIPAGQPFRRSQFTKQTIREWLSGLKDVSQPNRYRAALSSFAESLLDDDVIPSNPVRRVKMAQESAPRSLHLSPDDAWRLVAAIEEPYQALHALMLCTGMEISAALNVRRCDVDIAGRTIYARGTKRASRERTCTVYERWTWAFSYVTGHLVKHPSTPTALLFAGRDVWGSHRALKAALKATQLPDDYRQHDHRHTWAVQALRDGIEDHAAAYQLGHNDASMLRKVYGRYVPKRSDFTPNVTVSATPTLTKKAK